MDRKLFERKVENQNDICTRLTEIEENLKKLGRSFRTKEKITSKYEQFRALWTTFIENHLKFIVDEKTPEEYSAEFAAAVENLKELNLFVSDYAPELKLIEVPEVYYDPDNGKKMEVDDKSEVADCEKKDELNGNNINGKRVDDGTSGGVKVVPWGSRGLEGGRVGSGELPSIVEQHATETPAETL